jgi:tetratricopeptide (TPR) repeat protein
MPTPYEILGVRQDADDAAVRAAFRKAAKAYHPDLNIGDPATEQHLKQVIAAYQTLKSPKRRAACDRQLALRRRRDAWRFVATAVASTGMVSGVVLALVVWSLQPRETPTAPKPGVAAPQATDFVKRVPPAFHPQAEEPAGRNAAPDRGPPKTEELRADVAPAHDAQFYLARGLRRSKTSDQDGAIADFDAAIRLEPGNAAAYRHRAGAWCRKGDPDRALADYDAAVRIDAHDAGLFRDRGVLLRRRGSLDRALVDFDHAIRLGFSDARAYSERGLLWYAKGQLERAMADFDHAIKIEPDLAIAYVNRAMALRTRGDIERANADLHRAARIDPSISLDARQSAQDCE